MPRDRISSLNAFFAKVFGEPQSIVFSCGFLENIVGFFKNEGLTHPNLKIQVFESIDLLQSSLWAVLGEFAEESQSLLLWTVIRMI